MCPRIDCSSNHLDAREELTVGQWVLLSLCVLYSFGYAFTCSKLRKLTLESNGEPITTTGRGIVTDVGFTIIATTSLWRFLFGGATAIDCSVFDIFFSYEFTIVYSLILGFSDYIGYHESFCFYISSWCLKSYYRAIMISVNVIYVILVAYIWVAYALTHWSNDETYWYQHLKPGCDRDAVRNYEAILGVWAVLGWGVILAIRQSNLLRCLHTAQLRSSLRDLDETRYLDTNPVIFAKTLCWLALGVECGVECIESKVAAD